jgi:hypothetical protein
MQLDGEINMVKNLGVMAKIIGSEQDFKYGEM